MMFLLLSFFGLIGVWLRYGINVFVAWYIPQYIFLGTLFINIIGSFVIGVFAGLYGKIIPHMYYLPLTVGLLGGFTTFSGYSLDTLNLIKAHRFNEAVLYFFLSPCLGLFFVWCGVRISVLCGR